METARVRENRVISSYIEFKHPDVFKEAKEFYAELNERYPNKKDLRKTNEFEWMRTGFPTKRFYPRKRAYEKKKDNSKTGEIVDNMKLIITLMDRAEKTVETTETTAKTNQKVIENVVDMSADKEIEVSIEPAEVIDSFTDISIEPAEAIDSFTDIPIESAEVIIETFPAIPDNAIEAIIKELREDPDLDQIFNEFDADVDFDFDEESPLERELANW